MCFCSALRYVPVSKPNGHAPFVISPLFYLARFLNVDPWSITLPCNHDKLKTQLRPVFAVKHFHRIYENSNNKNLVLCSLLYILECFPAG